VVRDVVDKSTDSSNITIDKFNTEGLQTDASNETKTRLVNTDDNSGGDNQRNASNAYIKYAAVEDKEPEHEDLLFIDPTPTDKSQHQLEHTQMSNASRVDIQLVHSERTLLDKPRRRKRQVADALTQSTTSKTSTSGTKGSSSPAHLKRLLPTLQARQPNRLIPALQARQSLAQRIRSRIQQKHQQTHILVHPK